LDKLVSLVIKLPNRSRIKGRFLLAAEASPHPSNWIQNPVSARNDDAMRAEQDLSD
jgi:hypothetical protein